jgi:hypothetical protein
MCQAKFFFTPFDLCLTVYKIYTTYSMISFHVLPEISVQLDQNHSPKYETISMISCISTIRTTE